VRREPSSADHPAGVTVAPPLARWRAAAGDLLLGSSCHGCGAAAWTLCDDCRRDLAALPARPTQPEPCPPAFPQTWTAGTYDALARGLVSAHKERSALGLTRVLGERLALAVLALLDEAGEVGEIGAARTPVLLVPVPSTRRAVRTRGFDAGLALARAAARRLPDARAAPLLTSTRRVADQSGLGAAERQANLAGAFRVRTAYARSAPFTVLTGMAARGRPTVVVVDDVVTSGASLTEAVRALRAARLPVLGAATVAATVRRTPPGARSR
jgi:predicted amidophosphoribosyltransferase